MSLAILPSSPMSFSSTPIPPLPPPAPFSAKRPRLSLNTSTPTQVFGKGSTSLRLDTLSATSPTGRNTFRNGYGQDQASNSTGGAKPRRPTLTPLATAAPPTKPSLPISLHTDLPSSPESGDLTFLSAASTTSVSTLDSLSGEIPYKLAYNVTSILSNGPIPRTKGSKYAQARPRFPTPKKVTFRTPMTEYIKTSTYTMAHSDISSSCSTISTLELSTPESDEVRQAEAKEAQNDGDAEDRGAALERNHASLPRVGDKRESSDGDDSDTCPATPVAGRRKKSRQWRWTLGPIGSDSHPTSGSSQAVEDLSEDDESSHGQGGDS